MLWTQTQASNRFAIATIAVTAIVSPVAFSGAIVARELEATRPIEQRRVVYDAYILGPGDSLQIELLDIPELSGTFSIGPDGTLYLPRLRALYVEGLTVEELRYFLTEQFKAYVKKPELYVRPVQYRPIRVYVGGEVKRPGYYTLSGVQSNVISQYLTVDPDSPSTLSSASEEPGSPSKQNLIAQQIAQQLALRTSETRFKSNRGLAGAVQFPTVFDAIRNAEGITPFSDLSQVRVTRKQPVSAGGGRIRAQLDFLSVITEGEESQNIRLFDGDVVSVGRSPVVLREQLLKAGQTNLSPQLLQVFVSGRVTTPGPQTLPQGSSLNQAIVSAGGLKVLHGKVEFVRFTREGEIDRRTFRYNPNAPSDDYRNPILMAGDIIRVQESVLSATTTVLNELTAPAVGIYSVYSLFKP